MQLNCSFSYLCILLIAPFIGLSACSTKKPQPSAHQSRIFYLPFDTCKEILVTQGFKTQFSHRGQHAVDWGLDTGSTVTAALDGTVAKIKSDMAQGSKRPYTGNYVIIRHGTGLYSRYLHLKKDSVLVKPGQIVKTGEPLALSGNTGNSWSPHLHFDVVSSIFQPHSNTIPFEIVNKIGQPQKLTRYAINKQPCQ